MELISICPKGCYRWMYEQKRVMLLAHLADDKEYLKAANDERYKDVYRICDNSIIELGDSVTLNTILRAADKLHADEIILRDGYPRGDLTRKRILEDITELREKNLEHKYKIMAVCHGVNEEDFKETFELINSIPEITCIGIPKVLSTWCGDRANLFDIWSKTNKEIHYLGSWYSLKELLELPEEINNRIRSCDTCLPSLYAIQNLHVWENRNGTIDLSHCYKELTKKKYDKVLEEFNYLKSNHLTKI